MSAGDASQEAWYEAQLELKQEAGELPKVSFLSAALLPPATYCMFMTEVTSMSQGTLSLCR